MCDQKGGFPGVPDDLADIITYLQACLIVQGGKRLIEQEQFRIQNQSADQGGSLAHSSGQFGGPGCGKLFQPVLGEQLICLSAGCGVNFSADLQAQKYIAVNGAPFKQMVMLEHVADIFVIVGERFSCEQDLAGFGPHQSCNQREQCGFADGIVVETNGSILTRSSKVFWGMFTEKEMLEQSIASRIRYQMQKAGISQPKLAEAIGTTRDRIYTYENGKIEEQNMEIELLKKLARYFELDEYYFCNEYHVFMDTTDVPKVLKQLRGKKQMSQRQFAAKKNIPIAAYKSYESGKVRLAEKYWIKLKEELKAEAES